VKVLVVDDSSTMRRIVVNSLQKCGSYEVVEAENGEEALTRWTPDMGLVLTDWNMPVMSGLDFVKALRARPDGSAVPIIMITTRGVREDVLTAVSAGVTNYIAKPFTPAVLKEKIELVLSVVAA
jgi:two-component system, chemotaxis family, chemotaxis protein CheY